MNSDVLDTETTPTYSLTVTVTDNGDNPPALSDTATVTISIEDVNEAPVISDASRSVDENSAVGTTVGAVVTGSDVDAGNVLSYSIVGGNTGNVFAIDSSSAQVTVAVDAIDFESLSEYQLIVQVSDDDASPLTDTCTVTVSIVDVNESPTIAATTRAVDENSGGSTSVGAVVVGNDVDAGDTLAYTITGGTGQSLFAIASTTGQITVQPAASLDYEGTSSYSVEVTVTDTAGQSAVAIVTVNVNDVNESPAITGASVSVNENSVSGTTVSAHVDCHIFHSGLQLTRYLPTFLQMPCIR